MIDVANEDHSVAERLDWLRDEAPAEERTVSSPSAVEEPNVLVLDPAHRLGESTTGTLYEHVEVGRQDHESVNLDVASADGPRDAGHEVALIGARLERRSVHDTVEGSVGLQIELVSSPVAAKAHGDP